MRVSRKATNFDDITEGTFRNYCRELQSKYPEGAKIIRPNDVNLNGELLRGSPKLDVPNSNSSSARRSDFERIAESYDPPIEIIYKLE